MEWLRSLKWKIFIKRYEKIISKNQKYKILLKLQSSAHTFDEYYFLYQESKECPQLRKSSFKKCQELCSTFTECQLVYNLKPTLNILLKLIKSSHFFYQYAYLLKNCLTLHAVGLTNDILNKCISLANNKEDYTFIYDNTVMGSKEWRMAQEKLN